MPYRSDPVTKHIEYIGHYDSSIIGACGPGLEAVRVCYPRPPVKRRAKGLDQKQSDHYIRASPRSQAIDYRKPTGQEGTFLLLFLITPIVTCATAREVCHE